MFRPLQGLRRRVEQLEAQLNQLLAAVDRLERERLVRNAEHIEQLSQLESLYRRMSTRFQRHEQLVEHGEDGPNLALSKRLNGRR